MRLICPNCDAQYEVGDGVIPAQGRDVECSNCGHTWYQYPDDYDDRPAEDLEDSRPLTSQARDSVATDESNAPDEKSAGKPSPDDNSADENEDDFEASLRAALGDDEDEPAPTAKKPAPGAIGATGSGDPDTAASVAAAAAAGRRALPTDIAEILRSEAQREREARDNARQGKIETQADLGLEDNSSPSDQRAENARRRLAQFREEDAENTGARLSSEAEKASRREMLPDIDNINSSLRSTSDRKNEPAAGASDTVLLSRSRRLGFRLGFYVVIFAAIGLAMAYVMAPKIIEALPQAEPVISAWVKIADQMRWGLEDLIRLAIRKIAELTG